MFRSTTLATLLLVTAATAQCNPTVRMTSQFNSGWLCPTTTYCYEVCNPATCSLPITKVCIDFVCGVGDLDAGSSQSPAGWPVTINPVTNQVCWNAADRSEQLQPGQCRTFCITTNCNPRCLEGRQTYSLWGQYSVNIVTGGHTLIAFAGPYRNFLAGDAYASIGSPYVVTATNALDCGGQDFLLAGPFANQNGIPIPGLGLLHIDPVLVLPVGPIALGPVGIGQTTIPIPSSPTLVGAELMLQSLTFSEQSPRLSNLKRVSIR